LKNDVQVRPVVGQVFLLLSPVYEAAFATCYFQSAVCPAHWRVHVDVASSHRQLSVYSERR